MASSTSPLVWSTPTTSTWPSATASPTANTPAPTEDPYYALYMGVQATIPFALRNMAVQIALSSIVFTLYMILIFITRTRHRRTWTFGLATLVSSLFFASAFTNSIQLSHALQRPGAKVEIGIEFGDVILTLCLPWIGDWLIWLRMISLWPAENRFQSPYIYMFGAPVVIKLFRLGILCALLNHLYGQMATSMNAADLGSKVWPLGWLTWAEYGAMLLDIVICSGVCIIRLTTLMSPSHSERRSSALQSRLRLLLANTVSSFILPVVAAVVMIILGAAGTFDAYATMTKINAGVTAINVLIAIIIPMLQSNSVEDRYNSSDPSQQPNSFIRNKMRSRSVSRGGTPRIGGARKAGSIGMRSGNGFEGGPHIAHAQSLQGIVQTTLEESFVDHLDYGTQPYSPGHSLKEKQPHQYGQDGIDEGLEFQEGHELTAQQTPQHSDDCKGGTAAALLSADVERSAGLNAQHGLNQGVTPMNEQLLHAHAPPYTHQFHLPIRTSPPSTASNAATPPATVTDEQTLDVLKTMPRMSRFGQ